MNPVDIPLFALSLTGLLCLDARYLYAPCLFPFSAEASSCLPVPGLAVSDKIIMSMDHGLFS